MAPELLQGKEYGVAVDWWTLGCLMFEMVTGRGPFMSDDLQLLVRAITSTDPNIPSRVSAECAGAIRGLMNRSVDLRLDGIKIRSVPFYTGLDWDALFRMEIPAPYTPVDNEVDSDMSSHAEQRARLQAEFGEVWSSAPGPDKHGEISSNRTSANVITSNPMMGHGGGATSALAMELTSNGTVWRISNPLAELLGLGAGQGHQFFGMNFISDRDGVPPCIDPETLAPFIEAFNKILERLKAAGSDGSPTKPTMSVEHKPVRVLRPGGEPPVYLLYAFDETSKLTNHSVALMPTHEGHAAITVTFVDVTVAESAKDLVRKRYEISFNDKLDDEAVSKLFAPTFSFNAAGTQMPAREGAASRSPIERYLERRELLVRAFPDLHYNIVDQSASDERVVTSWAWSGTHTGPLHFEVDGEFIDVPPTGRRVLIHGISVDVCENGLITDHAAYYDAGAIFRQIRQKGDSIPRAADDMSSEESESSEYFDPNQHAAKALMSQFYARKVLSLLSTACNDLGFAICKGCPDLLFNDESCDLPIAVSSIGFARALGLKGDRPGLNLKLLHHLRTNVDTSIQPDALEVVDSLREAARFGRATKELVTLHRADRPHALLVNIAPFKHEGLDLVAVIIVDVNADPNHQDTAHHEHGQQGKEVDTAARHYIWQHDLLGGLSSQPGAHLGFCATVLSSALDAFDEVGFSLAVRNTPGLPMTWVSEGFLKLTGYRRAKIINRNCNRLQTGATDPDATFRLSEAIRTGRAERVTLWNVTSDGEGFWNCLSMYPSIEYNGTVVQYYVAAQVGMNPEFYKRLVRVQRSVRKLMEIKAAGAQPPYSQCCNCPNE